MAKRLLSRAFPWLFGAALGGATGCFPSGDGTAPPLDRIYFPTGIALSPSARWMYVVNSDFDLQFNAGTVQVYDLDALRQTLPTYCEADADCAAAPGGAASCDEASHWCVTDPKNPAPCGDLGEQSDADRLLYPGRCKPADPKPWLADSVKIGAFATDILHRSNPLAPGKGRLFVPVRGDVTLHWIDVADSEATLHCGQAQDGACDQEHRRGQEPAEENTRNAALSPEPFAIAAGDPDDSGEEPILTTHQSTGEVALFVNRWEPAGGAPVGPSLHFVLGGLAAGAMGIASIPTPAIVRAMATTPTPIAYQPSFLVTFRNSSQVQLIRYFSDHTASPNEAQPSPARAFLDATTAVVIGTNSVGTDSRGIAVDAAARKSCEATCASGDTECLTSCGALPLDVYIGNRAPPTLVIGKTPPKLPADGATDTALGELGAPSDDLPRFVDAVPVSVGASRVVVGDVIGKDGKPAKRVFIVCFDSRQIYVYDPASRRMEAQIFTGRGPHALAIDGAHGYGYIGHFTDSYIGVVDLDQRHTMTYGQLIRTVGQPVAPRAAK
jgi:hypothetical protein